MCCRGFHRPFQVQCEYVRCPLPYMGGEQPGAPVKPNSPPLGETSGSTSNGIHPYIKTGIAEKGGKLVGRV